MMSTENSAVENGPDLGSLVSLDHVNFRVPDYDPVMSFYIRGLGLTRDPYRMVGTHNFWCNAGKQQFHLQRGPDTPLHGEVGLVVPDVGEVRENLHQVRSDLEGTAFSMQEADGALLTTCPWGKRIRVLPAAAQPALFPVGIAYLELWVPPGTTPGIGRFYERLLHCPVAEAQSEGHPAVHVTVGPHQTLRFTERPDAQVTEHSNHAAFYATHFAAIRAELDRRGLVDDDQGVQYRFFDIVEPASGEKLFRFEHEMRTLYHLDFYRHLVNRAEALHTAVTYGRVIEGTPFER